MSKTIDEKLITVELISDKEIEQVSKPYLTYFKETFPNGLSRKDIEGKEVRTDRWGLFDLYELIAINFKIECSIMFWRGEDDWTRRTFNKNGKEIYHDNNTGYWSKMGYDESGNKTYYGNSNGRWYKSEYDERGNKTYYEDSEGLCTKSEYDERGNVIYTKSSNGNWIKREYDEKGNETYYERSDGELVKMEYDENGKMAYWESHDRVIKIIT